MFAGSLILTEGKRLTSCVHSRFESLSFKIESQVAEVVSVEGKQKRTFRFGAPVNPPPTFLLRGNVDLPFTDR